MRAGRGPPALRRTRCGHRDDEGMVDAAELQSRPHCCTQVTGGRIVLKRELPGVAISSPCTELSGLGRVVLQVLQYRRKSSV